MENQPPTARVNILIRRPVAEVFAAVTQPEYLTKFWLSSASGPLEAGKAVHWEFMVKGAEVDCFVRELTPNVRILIDWSDGTKLDWRFAPHGKSETVLEVENRGFHGDASEVVATALESTQGFSIVLCELKALLERGQALGLVRDKAILIEEASKAKG